MNIYINSICWQIYKYFVKSLSRRRTPQTKSKWQISSSFAKTLSMMSLNQISRAFLTAIFWNILGKHLSTMKNSFNFLQSSKDSPRKFRLSVKICCAYLISTALSPSKILKSSQPTTISKIYKTWKSREFNFKIFVQVIF